MNQGANTTDMYAADTDTGARETDIAIIGLGARFPDAWTPDEFWDNILHGRISLREIGEDELRAAGVPEDLLDAPDYVRRSGRVPGMDLFAAQFFGITPAEAELTDPQQRLFLEACWEALEHAGHPPTAHGPVTGVYAGASFSGYAAALYVAHAREFGGTALAEDDIRAGSQVDFLPARVAYRLGLPGPAVGIQTACSSSLVAVHQAVNALLAGDCDLALAGGVGLLIPETGYRYRPGGIVSEDGYCRSFDAASTGTANGAGVGAVVLRRLTDALADGDHIWAVVHGSAVNNDGADRLGFTAPSPAGVTGVVRAALDAADVPASRLRYVEAHGSGTPLGDHVELLGLNRALHGDAGPAGSCALGSVKTNVGHCGAAAGVAGLIKGVYVTRTGQLPPHPQFRGARDPGLLAEGPLRIDTEARECLEPDRLVLVHSMGQGGTNAAVILGPAPGPSTSPMPVAGNEGTENDEDAGTARLLISARTRVELDAASVLLADELDRGRWSLPDIAHTLRVGRTSFEHRRVVTGNRAALSAALRLPRRPAARTERAARINPLITRTDDRPAALAAEAALLAALGPKRRTTRTAPDVIAPDSFLIVIGDAQPQPMQHVLPVPAATEPHEIADLIDDALASAWLHGADVDWAAVADSADAYRSAPALPRARRVPLPTYPFQRQRFWALDPDRAPRRDRAPGDSRPTELTSAAAPSEPVEAGLVALWERLFGIAPIGVDDEFGALGGTSLLATKMALQVNERYGTRINLHRVGGTRATVRRIAASVRSRGTGADDDAALLDADLELPLGLVRPAGTRPAEGVLLTGATGFLGAFILHELCQGTDSQIYCIVRASDERAAWDRLAAQAADLLLPAPDPARVHVIPGDLREARDLLSGYRGGELNEAVGVIVHCASRVAFSEPYRTLRTDNVLATRELIQWAREQGIADFAYVSSLGACSPSGDGEGAIAETRHQSLGDAHPGYGTTKWASEQLLARAERDGLRVRVFRPGLVLGADDTGACNPKDVIWRVICAGLATGLHPADDEWMNLSPVDVVAKAVVSMMRAPQSAGRVYHLTNGEPSSLERIFDSLTSAGLRTEKAPRATWYQALKERMLRDETGFLAPIVLVGFDDGTEPAHIGVEAEAWRAWLASQGLDSAVDGSSLARSIRFLATKPGFRELLGEVLDAADAPATTPAPALTELEDTEVPR